MNILAIDPGTTESAYVIISDMEIKGKGKLLNGELLNIVTEAPYDIMAIEMPACYGMAVGKTVFETVLWVGKYSMLAELNKKPWFRVYRKSRNEANNIDGVCMAICKNNRAKDANIRQSIIDMYEPSGGGKIPQIGTKNKPGPLYGVSNDIWAALAVGITFQKALNENKSAYFVK